MVSDAIWLALIQSLTPTLTAVAAIIVALRAIHKVKEKDARKEGADAARGRRQRKNDKPESFETDAAALAAPRKSDIAQRGYPLGPGRDL